MLDYLAVKKFYAVKLAEDTAGDGRIESAFYHTVRMVYLKGVSEQDGVGILDGRDKEIQNEND